MLIEYYATDNEDRKITKALSNFQIEEWFNPEDDYYVLETHDSKVITILSLFGIEVYITDSANDG